MSYRNTAISKPFTPDPIAEDAHARTPREAYDLNCLIDVPVLEDDLVRLEPLIPSEHVAHLEDTPFVFVEGMIRRKPTSCIWVMIDKATGEVAGRIGYNHIELADRTVEISFVNINNPFRRTYVHTHAAYLALCRALDPPSEGGLGFFRATWWPAAENVVSRRAAERLGFEKEGRLTWFYHTDPAGSLQSPVETGQWDQMTINMVQWREGKRQRLRDLL